MQPPDRDHRDSVVPWQAALALGVGTLVLLQRWGRRGTLFKLVGTCPVAPPLWALYDLLWWAFTCVLGYFVVPALLIRARGGRLEDCGWRWPQWRHAPMYAALYLCVLPGILVARHQDRFQAMYPFYRYAREAPELFLVWWTAYALMFVSLEFFFRGFLIHSLWGRFGSAAILISAVPYFCIHYAKPFPEFLASFPAGLALGYLARRTGSIGGGAALHVAVAFSMDAMVLLF